MFMPQKPLTAYVREGRILVDAVRKRRTEFFNVGTQPTHNGDQPSFVSEVHSAVERSARSRKCLAVAYPGPRRYEGLP